MATGSCERAATSGNCSGRVVKLVKRHVTLFRKERGVVTDSIANRRMADDK